MIKRVAILCRPDDKSPKILAKSFGKLCNEIGVESKIFFNGTGMLSRLFGLFEKTRFNNNFQFRARQKYFHLIRDFKLIRELRSYDLIILSECIPNAYWRGFYDIEKLKKLIKKPIALYEVYFLGNSVTHTQMLKQQNHFGIERFDWNFSISEITELRSFPNNLSRWSTIGLNLEDSNLKCENKDEIIALVDFEQDGFIESMKEQIEILEMFPKIKIINLKGSYSMEEIRTLYKSASLFFIQFPEAFGVSIAECLSTGCMVVIKEINWAMSWRLQNQFGIEYLPECFFAYENKNNLYEFLKNFTKNFDSTNTPKKTHDIFLKYYSNFYYGNPHQLKKSIDFLGNNL
jgi:hypothetical protein